MLLPRRLGDPREASAAGTAPSRRTRGSGPVRSSTVDGVPGSSPTSRTAATPARISSGTSSTRRGSGPPCRFALVAATTPTRSRSCSRRAGELGNAHADRVRPRASQPGEPPRRIRERRACTGLRRTRCAGSSGISSAQRLDARGDERDRLLGRASLERRQRADGLLAIGPAREPVDGVRRDHDEPAGVDRPHDLLDGAHETRVPSTTRSRPARSCVVVTSAYPRLAEQRRDPCRVARTRPRARARLPRGGRRPRPVRRPRSPPRRRARPAAPSRAPPARASSISSGRTYGGFETTRSHGPSGSPVKRSHSRSSIASPVRSAFAPATSSAPDDASIPVTRAPGCSSAIASAIAPLPVPTSRTRGSARPAIRARQRSTTISVSGRGTSTRRSTREREPPEAPLAEHVRERLARLAAGDQPLERLLLRARQLARRLERELRPREPEHVRDEDLGVDAGRVAAGRRETLGRLVDRPPGLHAEAAASAWRCSSARSASVSSPMSPSSTWSSRCSVSLTR